MLETQKRIGQKNFRKRMTTWVKIADLHGIDALKHPTTCTEYTVEERYALVARVLDGESQKSANINDSQLSNGVKRYKINGYNGLDLKKGRHSKEQPRKKSIISSELTSPEKEELIRLRAETEYLKTENEAIKKSIALRKKNETARLTAKKHQLSKNLENKDTN